MAAVGIVTDSTNCLPPDLIRQYDIRVVPVGVVLDGKLYRDVIDITPDQYWRIYPTLKDHPTTTAGTPGDFVRAFSDLAAAGKDTVCILVSKALTSTNESAYVARKIVKSDCPNANIHILDSRTSAGALGFIVLEAARAAQSGKTVDEVVGIAEDMTSRVIYLASLDTLKYLIRAGRAPRNAEIGEKLGVKPVIGFVDDTGIMEVVARVGGRDSAVKKMVDLVKKYTDTGLPLHVMVHYSNSISDAEQLKQMLQARYRCSEVYVSPLSAVCVTHTGPTIGMGFYS